MSSAHHNPLAKQVGAPPRRLVDLIVIHCSATPSGKALSEGQAGKPGYLNAPQVINAWHAARGFKRATAAVRAYSSELPSIGYHYVIDIDGQVWAGRALDEVGAHALNYNMHSAGICMIGGAEREGRFTAGQWASLTKVVEALCAQFNIPVAPPTHTRVGNSDLVKDGICGHRELSPDGNGNGIVEPFEWLKTCPGFDVRAWLARGMQPDPKHVYQEAAL